MLDVHLYPRIVSLQSQNNPSVECPRILTQAVPDVDFSVSTDVTHFQEIS